MLIISYFKIKSQRGMHAFKQTHQITQISIEIKNIHKAFLSTNLVIIIYILIYIFGLPDN